MCRNGTHEVTSMYLSASSADLGEGTRCTCILVALSPTSNGSYFALNQAPRVSNCSASLTVRGSFQAQYTCLSGVTNSQVTMNTSEVIIEVLKKGSLDFGFCLNMIDSSALTDHKFNLTCENDAMFNGTTTSQPTGSSTPVITLSPTSSSSTHLSLSTPESPGSSTSPLPTPTTNNSTVQMSTLLPASATTSPYPASPSVIPVAAGVAGGLVFLLLVIIIIVVVCVRRKRHAKETPPPPRLEINICNMNFSQVNLEDNILYESSTAAPKSGGATQGGGPGGGGHSGHLGRGQYLGPAGDVYSLAQKTGKDPQSTRLRSMPGQDSTEVHQNHADNTGLQYNSDPALQYSSDPTLQYNSDPTLQYSRAKEDNHPEGGGMSSASLRSSPPTPGLRYTNVELGCDQDGKTVKVSSEDDSAATEYTSIDHEATKNMTTEL